MWSWFLSWNVWCVDSYITAYICPRDDIINIYNALVARLLKCTNNFIFSCSLPLQTTMRIDLAAHSAASMVKTAHFCRCYSLKGKINEAQSSKRLYECAEQYETNAGRIGYVRYKLYLWTTSCFIFDRANFNFKCFISRTGIHPMESFEIDKLSFPYYFYMPLPYTYLL